MLIKKQEREGKKKKMKTDLMTFLEKYPHNTDTADRFMSLVKYCYDQDSRGFSLDEFVQFCLDSYGGTIAGAMVDYLRNK
jgi:hypothetical protein